MKVATDLRAGSMLSDATQKAEQIVGQASDFITTANRQAESLTSSVTTKATSLWNCLNNTFS